MIKFNMKSKNKQKLQIPKLCFESDIIDEVNGDFGQWQLRTILLIFLCKLPSSWFMACVIYTAPAPKGSDYFCRPMDELFINNSTQDWVQMSQPTYVERKTDREFRVDFCDVFENNLDEKFAEKHSDYTNPFQKPEAGSNVIPCYSIEEDTEYSSLVTEFNLVCSRNLLVSVTQSFHAFGTLIGGLIATKLLQYVSPRRLMLVGMILQIICGNLTGLVTSYELHVLFRCLTALFCAFMYTSGQMIFADITNGKAKTITTTLFELFWSIGLILLPAISIFIDSWTYLYVAISSPTIILVFLHRFITDSPRWHIRHGNIDKTLKILLESATFNNKSIPLDLECRLQQYAEEVKDEKRSGVFSIWDGINKRKYLFSVHMAWTFAVMLYNAMIINTRAFGVDHIHVNTVILGFAEMIGVFIGLYIILYTRRRWLWVGRLIAVAGILTFFIWLVPNDLAEHKRVGLDMVFCVGLKIANAASLSVLVTCTSEMVTDDKRPALMLSVVTWSRIWLILSPYIIALTVIHPLIPVTIFAGLAVLNGICMCLIDRRFWNKHQPYIPKVPTVQTFRRNSAIMLSRRNSNSSDKTDKSNEELKINNTDSTLKVSIEDIWTILNEDKPHFEIRS